MEKNYFVSLAKDKYARAIAKPTADALTEFCRQEPEFEQAIEQSGKSFDDCLTAITKGIGQSISDLEIYTRAVKFYFPVAAVRFHMTIDRRSRSIRASRCSSRLIRCLTSEAIP